MTKYMFSIFFMFVSSIYAFDATIPVLHLPDYFNEETKQQFLDDLEYALHEVGFFALTGTGVCPTVLDKAYDNMKEFFSLDIEEKRKYVAADSQRGFYEGESAKGEKGVDLKEFFGIGRELSDEDLLKLSYGKNLYKNIWPNNLFKDNLLDLYNNLDSCSYQIGSAIAELLGKDSEYLNSMTKEGDVLMRALFYPACPPKDATWGAEHTDIDLYTILPRASSRGLQVLNKQGQWIDVIVPDGAFVINCGDLLENLSNGYFRSAVHRVIDNGLNQDRYSLVFFVHPRSEDRMDPLAKFIEMADGNRHYANATRMELLAERLIDMKVASYDLMEFFVESGAIERLKEVGRFSTKAKQVLIEAGFDIE